MADDDETGEVAAKWSSDGAGERYATQRFRAESARQRDPRMVGAILRGHGVRGRVLDVPCGSGRLGGALAKHARQLVGADVSRAMLDGARAAEHRMLVCADAAHLPFADRSFDVVVCCRLLHHLREREQLERVVAELARVSDRLIVASFWDAASLPAWRVRLGLKRGEGPRGRAAIARGELERALDAAGARAVEYRHSFRFVSQQTFVVAERVR
jgi:SAM-dependent methyltransferase